MRVRDANRLASTEKGLRPRHHYHFQDDAGTYRWCTAAADLCTDWRRYLGCVDGLHRCVIPIAQVAGDSVVYVLASGRFTRCLSQHARCCAFLPGLQRHPRAA
ncbi:hypothetical protein MRX96_043400 [Rhipicephalus microplus]